MPRKASPAIQPRVVVPLSSLHSHPRNYRGHPEEQLAHIEQSIRENGIYRNVVIASDNTILAGHGVVLAARRLGMTELPVVKLEIESEDPRALKVLAGDNELGLVADSDDRLLSEILRDINDVDGLLGTGYDAEKLANLIYVTRPASEIADLDTARHWVGLPKYEDAEPGGTVDGSLMVVVHLASEEDRTAFMKKIGAQVVQKKTRGTWSIWWPERQREDLASVRFE